MGVVGAGIKVRGFKFRAARLKALSFLVGFRVRALRSGVAGLRFVGLGLQAVRGFGIRV